jgi:hypothetical protein
VSGTPPRTPPGGIEIVGPLVFSLHPTRMPYRGPTRNEVTVSLPDWARHREQTSCLTATDDTGIGWPAGKCPTFDIDLSGPLLLSCYRVGGEASVPTTFPRW